MSEPLVEKIRKRAFEIYQCRQETGQQFIFEKGELREITAEDDWHEAKEEVLRKAEKDWG